MQTYLLTTSQAVAPFGEPAGAVQIHDSTLADVQQRVLRALGCRVESIDDVEQIRQFPCLLIADDVYFTYHALAGFLRAAMRARDAGGSYRAALAVSELTESFTRAFQGELITVAGGQPARAFDLYFLRHFDRQQPLAAQATPLAIPHRLKVRRFPANRFFEPTGHFALPISTVFLHPIRHWSAVITANLLGMPSFFVRQATRPAAMLGLPGKLLWRTGSIRPSRLRAKTYIAGRGCRVDPTAHVEHAVLGDRVRIGPHAFVRGTVIGDYTQVGPSAILEGCTLGRWATINGGVTLRGCVVGDGAGIGAYFTQFSLIGRGAAMCPGSVIYDFNFRGNVPVRHQGKRIPSGSRCLGGCLGHRAFLGPQVVMSSGQEVPNDCILIENPRTIVGDAEAGLPERIVRLEGERFRAAG
jgi:carbonic anhydrase/acetyltransferase-like protein (isoleucine patch superfamily)